MISLFSGSRPVVSTSNAVKDPSRSSLLVILT
jgi:hypothetical protein